MEEVYQELKTTAKKGGGFFDSIVFYYIIILSLIAMFGIYVGNILFGTNSIEVLIQLENRQKNLQERVEYLKQSNAKLQKEYFELKELEPK